MPTATQQIQTRPWAPVPASYASRDQLPDISPAIGDGIGYACGSDGFDRIHPEDALRRMQAGKPVYYTTFASCQTEQDVKDARAILSFRLSMQDHKTSHIRAELRARQENA